MNPTDYTPGPEITTAAELAAWLAHEDAVFWTGANGIMRFVPCNRFSPAMERCWLKHPAYCQVTQALVRCPQSAGEMRAATERAYCQVCRREIPTESGQVCAACAGEPRP